MNSKIVKFGMVMLSERERRLTWLMLMYLCVGYCRLVQTTVEELVVERERESRCGVVEREKERRPPLEPALVK
jgi:hypothetical protein